MRQINRFRCKLGHRKMSISIPILFPNDNQLLPAVKHPSNIEIVETYHSEQGNRNETLGGGVFRKGDLTES